MRESSDVLVSRGARDDDEVDRAPGVRETGYPRLAPFDGRHDDRVYGRRIFEAGDRPEGGRNLIRRMR